MRRLLLVAVGAALVGTDPPCPVPGPTAAAPPRDVATRFALAVYKFSNSLYKAAAVETGAHFVISELNVWLSLAAMAEGATGGVGRELLQATGLPPAERMRKEYYALARRVATSDGDVRMSRKRVLLVDESGALNSSWASEVRALGLLEAARLPAPPAGLLPLEGASLLADSLDFEAALADAYLERDAPFYDDAGRPLGCVDLVRFERRVKLARVPLLNVEAIKIPVGLTGRYSLLVAMNVDGTPLRATIEKMSPSIIPDIFANMRESARPLRVAVPALDATGVLPEVRALLERAGVRRLWRAPPAPPAAYLQRASLRLGAAPARPAPHPQPPAARDFIVNRPFMYTLVDSATRVNCFSGAFSRPPKPLRP